jgi:malate dehydrogenase (oxaloacetate-decarboxylating)
MGGSAAGMGQGGRMTTRGAPSAQYSITMRLEVPHEPGWVARIAGLIAERGAAIRAIDLVRIQGSRSLRDYTVECPSTEGANAIVAAIRELAEVEVHSVSDETFLMHLGGKLEITPTVPLKTRADLSMAYTPGVARVCRAIAEDPSASFNLTIRKNCVAVVSDGSAVLGLGNIGPEAALPVMEGKAILFKEFGSVDAVPLCVGTQEPDEIIAFCRAIAPTFGGINLEDIAAPKCFSVEEKLREELEIPVFHDDQHGTAVVVLAGTLNALRLTGRRPDDLRVVVAGAGAAGLSCTRILLEAGIPNIVVCDREGAIHAGRDVGDNPAKAWLAAHTNSGGLTGSLREVIEAADMFLGVSAPGLLTRDDLRRMAPEPIVFAMANPVPEIMPEEAEGIASVIATGRSDYPNQINNVLAFPGIFRGALDSRAVTINEEMKRASARAIAEVVGEDELSREYIVPSVFNRRVADEVAAAVSRAARETGVARRIPKTVSL